MAFQLVVELVCSASYEKTSVPSDTSCCAAKKKNSCFCFSRFGRKKKKNTQKVKALTDCNILFPSIGCIYGVFPQLQESCDSLHNDLDQHMVPLLSVKGTIKKYIHFM